jgi:cell division septation protein DedD
MSAEEKAAGSSIKASARKKHPYRSHLTVVYIMAVMACLILGYIVGTRLLPSNEDQLAQTTMAGVDSGSAAGTVDGSSGQKAETVLPPLSPLVTDPDKTGAGLDDSIAGMAGSAALDSTTSAPRSSSSGVPQISLPTVGSSATASGTVSGTVSGTASGASVQPGSGSSPGVTASQIQSIGSEPRPRTQPQSQPQSQSRPQAQPAPKEPGVRSTTTSTGNQLFRVIIGRRDGLADAKALEAQAKDAGLEVWISGSGPYQVQVGAFKSRANAIAYAQELQGKGFPEATVIEPAS